MVVYLGPVGEPVAGIGHRASGSLFGFWASEGLLLEVAGVVEQFGGFCVCVCVCHVRGVVGLSTWSFAVSRYGSTHGRLLEGTITIVAAIMHHVLSSSSSSSAAAAAS